MNKILITGFSGFVSKHFLDYLDTLEEKTEVYGIDINNPDFDLKGFKNLKCFFKEINLLNKEEVSNVLYQVRPDYILHLASFSSVSFSWQNPVASFVNNTNIFLNLVEQLRELNIKCRVLSVGSSEEYGNVSADDIPLKETTPLAPISPYAVARVSQEMLTNVFVDGYGMDIVLTRSFNHIGPGQKEIFAISSFVKQIVNIKKNGLTQSNINVGDISIIRDFIDVRDVVKAYYLLLIKGRAGEVYNVCSGIGHTLNNIIDRLAVINQVDLKINVDKSLIRPGDNRIIIGDNNKLKIETNWSNNISLDTSLEDISSYWSARLL